MNKFEIVSNQFRKHPNVEIELPQRNDNGSAGYDIKSPVDVEIKPGERALIWTDIKSNTEYNWYLAIYIRSSLGIKHGIVLSNIVGIIDRSYYENPSNDGNIGVSLWNTSNETCYIKKGDRIVQGIFKPHGITVDDSPVNESRIGGLGSSGK